MEEILRMRINEARKILFGCIKKGGRSLGKTRREELEKLHPGSTCEVKNKKGESLYYRKPEFKKEVAQKEKEHLAKEKKKIKGQEKKPTQKKTKKGKSRVDSIKAKVDSIKKEAKEEIRRVDEIPAYKIKVDPKRFQFKIMGELSASGEVGSLQGIKKYDPNLAGILQVWKEPETGDIFVVNGHNRLALAKRFSPETKVTVMALNVPTAQEARAIGALTNIAEGRGTPLDAAKFFRDTQISKKDLEEKGVQLKEKVASDGINIAQLPKVLFYRVVDGDLSEEVGSAIGGSGFTEEKQYRLFEMVQAREKKGHRVSSETVKGLIDLIKSSQTSTKTTSDLFGDFEEEEDHYFELVDLQDNIKRRISKDKRIFGMASRSGRDLSKVGTIDIEKSKDIAKLSSLYLNFFEMGKNQAGELQKVLDKGAARIKNAANKKQREAIQNDVYEKIYAMMPSYIESLGVKQEYLFER